MMSPKNLLLGAFLGLLTACTAKLPDGTAGGGASGGAGGGGGGGNSATTVTGTVYNSQSLLPQPGVMVQSGTNFAYSDTNGGFSIDLDGSDPIEFFDDMVYPASMVKPADSGTQFRDISVVPKPANGQLFDDYSGTITNRYLAGLQVGDIIQFHENGMLAGAEVEFKVVNKEYNHGIWALRIRWGEYDWANHFVIAEDIYGNIRLLEYNSVVVDMNHPPILLPEVATIGQVLVDFWGQECEVTSVSASISPSPQLGMTEPLEYCLQTTDTANGFDELWAPGFGLAGTKKVGLGRNYFSPTGGQISGANLGGNIALYDSSSTAIQNAFLPGLSVGDQLIWEGTGDNSGRSRTLSVVDVDVLANSGIQCLVLNTIEDFIPVETLWIAQDISGNLRILQEVMGVTMHTYPWDRAPIWCPSSVVEGSHLGQRGDGHSQEIEHVNLEINSNFGFGALTSIHEVEMESDAGLAKVEYFWTPNFGPLLVKESTTAGWELSGGRLDGADF